MGCVGSQCCNGTFGQLSKWISDTTVKKVGGCGNGFLPSTIGIIVPWRLGGLRDGFSDFS